MLSIVQNFICTKKERLEVIERNSVKLGEVFKDVQFYINYNSDVNFENVKKSYSKSIPKLNLYNDLTKDWALVTLALMKEVQTPYVMYICEDMEVNCSEDEMWNALNEFMNDDYDLCFLSKIGKYLDEQFINGYTPYNDIPSPGYKPLEHGYFYLGKHAPHKRVPVDAIFKTKWLIERLEEFLEHGEKCTHDIPFRKRHLPNFWEGYYDFHNGMRRFGDMKCHIPKQVIFKEFNNIKDKD
mgnify:FL=1|tara:strand:- start:6332 stop:7051 length:720 start_codon:yes stop_codon:yes gene_type:complete